MKQTIYILGWAAFMLVACNNHQQNTETTSEDNSSDTGEAIPAPATLIFNVADTIHHDNDAFTEGFEFHDGKLVESTGEYGKSSIRIYNPKGGSTEKRIPIKDSKIFGEGITFFRGKLYQLTYREHQVLVYDEKNFNQPIQRLTWPKEGWGMTNDGSNLLVSDGSSNLYYVKPEDFSVVKTLAVNSAEGAIDQLNELEFVDGYIYANRWHEDAIYKIDPNTGYVVGKMHFEGMLEHYLPSIIRGEEDVLNGIAYDKQEKMLYLTGKNWPITFKVTF